MAHFMVLLYDNVADAEEWAKLSAEEIQRVIERYASWSDGLAEKGKLVGGEKLRDGEGRVLRGRGGSPVVLDGPFSETKEVIGGYFVLDVADYDEAVGLLRDCPHLEYGGTMEVRAVDNLDPVGDTGGPAPA